MRTEMNATRRSLAITASTSVLIASIIVFAVQATAGEGDVDESAHAEERAASTADEVDRRSADIARYIEPPPSLEEIQAGKEAFADVASVLQSPRCVNCHPAGNRPMQTDESRPHSFAISRTSTESGLECATCHREQNSEAWGVEGGPPGSPHWGLPPADMPMVFEGRTLGELCEQLKDPSRSGHDDLDEFIEHLIHDPLVHWGWEPGGDRTTPPLEYDDFLERARIWVDAGGPCPE